MADSKPLEFWISRATDPYLGDNERYECVETLCNRVNAEAEGATISIEILSHKVVSPDQDEALFALQAIDALVRRCGEKIHVRVGRHRFLNQIVKLLTPKYLGSQTSQEVKDLSIRLLYTWQKSIRHIGKFKEVYGSLKEHGLIAQDPAIPEEELIVLPLNASRLAVFEDEEKSRLLKQLLSSGLPDDLQAANRLIKNLVRAEEVKIAKVHQRKDELEHAMMMCSLMDEAALERAAACLGIVSTKDTDARMKKVYDDLLAVRPALYKIAGELAESNDPALAEVLSVNDHVNKTITKHNKGLSKKAKLKLSGASTSIEKTHLIGTDQLLDFSTENCTLPSDITSSPVALKKAAKQLEELLDMHDSLSPAEQKDVPFIGFDKNMTPVLPRRSGQRSAVANPDLSEGVPISFLDIDIMQQPAKPANTPQRKPTLNELSAPSTSALSLGMLGNDSSKDEHESSFPNFLPSSDQPTRSSFDANLLCLDASKDPLVILDKDFVRVVLYWAKEEPRNGFYPFIVSSSNVHVDTMHDVRITMWTSDKNISIRLQKCAYDLPGFSLTNPVEPANRLMSVLPFGDVDEAEIDFSITFTRHIERSITGSFTIRFK